QGEAELTEDHGGKNSKPGDYGGRKKNCALCTMRSALCDLCASALKDLFAVRFRFIKIVNKIHDFGGINA
ncbi:hypothetical protein L0128_18930, partial [candidate division KSB1 bacterium]|nr:hypothetical protein [candidate division KSB1 bacterium]